MPLPTDPTLTKYRILIERSKRKHDPIIADLEAQLQDAKFVARNEQAALLGAFCQRARELGYCCGCEKPLDECECVWLAGRPSVLSPMPVNGPDTSAPFDYRWQDDIGIERATINGDDATAYLYTEAREPGDPRIPIGPHTWVALEDGRIGVECCGETAELDDCGPRNDGWMRSTFLCAKGGHKIALTHTKPRTVAA